MRKLKLLCLCGLTAAVLMTGCAGSTDTTNVNLGSATVSEYRGVKINVAAPEVTDDEVDQKIQTNLKQNPNEVEVDRAAQDGDIVNIDYKGTKDGEAFDGGTAEGQDLTLGSGSMIDGFEDGLVGAKKGETKTLDLTFPENYREESLAGQAVVFEVTVNAVKEKQDAVLDDAFVQRTSDYQTVDEYKEGIRADLLAQKQKTAEQEMEQDVLQDIIDNSDFKFSRNGLSVRYNQMLKQYTNQAKMYGMTLSHVPALVHGHKLAQLHGLGPLASHALQALGGQAHVRNGRAAVQQVVHTLPVLQLHPQLRHHVVGHQPRPAVLGLQSDVHQIVGKMVQLLLVLRPCQVGKDGFALGGDPALPGLSIVQHPPQLLHKAAVDIAAKALEVPLDVRGVYLASGRHRGAL